MKTRLLFFTLIFISTFAQANAVEDSLIANIGKKAKVIFYAENKADLNEIAKYDLNKLFAEVRKRSEKNFSNNEEVTLREADELKNRDVNTTVSTKKWLRNMNLNLFVGASNIQQGQYDYNTFMGNYKEIVLPNNEKRSISDISVVLPVSGFVFGIGVFKDKILSSERRVKTSIKYGYGLEFMTHKVKLVNSFFFNKYPTKDFDIITNNFIDSLNDVLTKRRASASFNNTFENLPNTNLYFQFMPNFYFFNKKGQNTWSFGAGIRIGLSLNTMGKIIQSGYYSITTKYNSQFGDYQPNRLFYKFETLDIPYLTYKYKPLQTSFIFNVGYKFINLFYNINLSHMVIRGYSTTVTDINGITNYSTGFDGNFTRSTHSLGLRFGK